MIPFFFLSGFSFTDTDNSQDSRGREGIIFFHSTTSTRSRTFRHLFATLHVRWLSHIFNRNACIYQTATWWDYHLIELLFDWLMMWYWFLFICLLVELILGFVTAICFEIWPATNRRRRVETVFFFLTNKTSVGKWNYLCNIIISSFSISFD